MGAGEFFRRTVTQLAARRWAAIALLFLVFLGGTGALLALHKPAAGARPDALFVVAGLVRALAAIWISVAAFRLAVDSPRRPWLPDGAFWLYFLLSLLALAASAVGAALGRSLPDLPRIFVVELAALVLIAPLSRWMVAAAVERPLAWRPAPWFRGLGAWLPPFLVLALLIVLPLAGLHAWLSLGLIKTAGNPGFWLLAAADALVGTVLALIVLALRLTAYRSVALA